jgi:hypothetical protein
MSTKAILTLFTGLMMIGLFVLVYFTRQGSFFVGAGSTRQKVVYKRAITLEKGPLCFNALSILNHATAVKKTRVFGLTLSEQRWAVKG